MNILVINCGSSSLKYQLIDMNGEEVLAIGQSICRFHLHRYHSRHLPSQVLLSLVPFLFTLFLSTSSYTLKNNKIIVPLKHSAYKII